MFNYHSVTMCLSQSKLISYPCLALALMIGLFLPRSIEAAESDSEKRFLSQLVWCTDKDKPADKELGDLDAKLGKKIRKIFKWKNYFEISSNVLSLPSDDGKRLKISDRCEVVVRELDGSQIEVVLFGDKKLAGKALQNYTPILTKGEHLVIGGDDKDNYGDAWLLIISAAPKGK